MCHTQFSFVSKSVTPIATGYIQLCPLTAQATHNWPLNFPFKNVLSTTRYGLQPLRKPSTQGFIAKNSLLNHFFVVDGVVINHNKGSRTALLYLSLKSVKIVKTFT